MRDIRQDLRERLGATRSKRELLKRQLASIDSQEQTLVTLLEAEEGMWQQLNPPLFEGTEEKPQSSPLSQVLLETLKTNSGTASLEELKKSAVERGVPFGDKQPGRVIHFAMLGMAQHKLVERKGDGSWMLVEQAVN
jgi:hypothetical protein